MQHGRFQYRFDRVHRHEGHQLPIALAHVAASRKQLRQLQLDGAVHPLARVGQPGARYLPQNLTPCRQLTKAFVSEATHQHANDLGDRMSRCVLGSLLEETERAMLELATNSRDDRVLVGKVLVDRADTHPRLLCDAVGRESRKSIAREDSHRTLQNGLDDALTRCTPRSGARSPVHLHWVTWHGAIVHHTGRHGAAFHIATLPTPPVSCQLADRTQYFVNFAMGYGDRRHHCSRWPSCPLCPMGAHLDQPGETVAAQLQAKRDASVWHGGTQLIKFVRGNQQVTEPGQWHVACCAAGMLKTLFISLTMTTACATSDKPATPKGGAMSANIKSEASANVTFATSRDGTRIAFEKVGRGPALVIVGGALSHRDGSKALAGKLSDRFTVYTYDRRGRGESSDTKPYAVDREIEDLAAVIEHAGNKAFVYGVSSGGALALQSAVKLGAAKVPRLAIYEAPYGQDERAFKEQKERTNQLVQTGKPGDAAAFFFYAIGTPPQALEDMKRSPSWDGIKKIDFTLAYDYAVLGNGSVPESIKLITVPTLVLDGEKSLDFMHATANRIADLVPQAQRKTIKSQTHQAAPEAVAPLLTDFFGEEARPTVGAAEIGRAHV